MIDWPHNKFDSEILKEVSHKIQNIFPKHMTLHHLSLMLDRENTINCIVLVSTWLPQLKLFFEDNQMSKKEFAHVLKQLTIKATSANLSWFKVHW